MVPTTSLPAVLPSFLEAGKAVTIAKRVCITETIIDAVFVGVTPLAAHLYGYPSPDQFLGKWLSQTHSVEVAKSCFLVAYSRHHGLEIDGIPAPDIYVAEITRRDGTTRDVVKTVLELIIENDTYWVTHIEDADGEQSLPHVRTFQSFPSDQAYTAWSGTATVAQVERYLGATKSLEPVKKLLIQNTESRTIVSETRTPATQKKSVEGGQVPDLQVPYGGCVELPRSLKRDKVPYAYMMWCVACNEISNTETPIPEQCPKCRSRLWKGDFVKDVRRSLRNRPETIE